MDRKKCKKCNRGKLSERTKRGFWVKTILFWLPIKRYRCDYCNKKSYVVGSATNTIKQPKLQIL